MAMWARVLWVLIGVLLTAGVLLLAAYGLTIPDGA